MLEKERAIFFDIKNVILHFDPKKMRKQIAEICNLKEDMIEDILLKTGWGEKYEKGEIDSRTLFHYLPPNVQGKEGFSRWAEAISNVFEPNDSICVLLKELKRNQIKIFILSNICEMHFSYAYTHFPAFHLFDGYILSYKEGIKKPDYQLYDLALQKTNTEKRNSFFIEGIEEYAQKARLLDFDCESYLHIDLLRSQLKKRELLT
ncbi:MAG: HAD hydrolase-like protein [Verrucomicrobia bacterium]|nr:HAD hydrolase-like protein [Verrucomicrobiota bacterium]